MNKSILLTVLLLSTSSIFATGSWITLNGSYYYYSQDEPFKSGEYPDADKAGYSSYGPELSLFIAFRRGGHFGILGKYSLQMPYKTYFTTSDGEKEIAYDGKYLDLISLKTYFGPGYQFRINEKIDITASLGFMFS